MGFTKLDDGITKSSLWSESIHVRIVFISFLAEKDESGFVSAARSGMIRICNVTPEQFDEAEKILSSPDFESKDPSNEGRRIEKVDGGWIVLNSDKYRIPEDEKKKNHTEYMRNWRENKVSVKSREFTNIHNVSPSVSASVSVSASENSSLVLSSFEKFWTLYPKRTGKGAAEKAWSKIKAPSETLALITTALSWQVKSEQWTKDGGQYIPMPATYLNQRRWEDQPTKSKTPEWKFS